MRTPTRDFDEYRHSLRDGIANRRGVTLVELIIVIMVMGIMTAVAAPKFFETLLFHRVETAAYRVKADLELTRHTARLTSTSQSVTFTTSGYSVSGPVSALDDPSRAYAVDLAGAPYELSGVAANFSGALTISFDGYGTPSSGGTVTLGLRGHRCTVTVDGVTGEVSISNNQASGGMPPDENP